MEKRWDFLFKFEQNFNHSFKVSSLLGMSMPASDSRCLFSPTTPGASRLRAVFRKQRECGFIGPRCTLEQRSGNLLGFSGMLGGTALAVDVERCALADKLVGRGCKADEEIYAAHVLRRTLE